MKDTRELTIPILSIDAWAEPTYETNDDNEEACGWFWNNWFRMGAIPLHVIDGTENEILSYLAQEGYLNPKYLQELYIDDDQYNLVVCEKKTHMPLIALAYGEVCR